MKKDNLYVLFKGIITRFMGGGRTLYHKIKRCRFRNKHITLICNNCTGGVILHDLRLRFDTPTINLNIPQKEFLSFVTHLREYIACELKELHTSEYAYPIGILSIEDRENVHIHFMHYTTFGEAKKKWEERRARIHWNNVFVLLEGPFFDKEIIDACSHVEYPLAVMGPQNVEFECRYPFYCGFKWYNDWYPGKSLDYKHLFGLKRYLDDFDYISFLKGYEYKCHNSNI